VAPVEAPVDVGCGETGCLAGDVNGAADGDGEVAGGAA
jgi:hypothetical protein